MNETKREAEETEKSDKSPEHKTPASPDKKKGEVSIREGAQLESEMMERDRKLHEPPPSSR